MTKEKIEKTDYRRHSKIIKEDIRDLKEKLLFVYATSILNNKLSDTTNEDMKKVKNLKNLLKERITVYGIIQEAKLILWGQWEK